MVTTVGDPRTGLWFDDLKKPDPGRPKKGRKHYRQYLRNRHNVLDDDEVPGKSVHLKNFTLGNPGERGGGKGDGKRSFLHISGIRITLTKVARDKARVQIAGGYRAANYRSNQAPKLRFYLYFNKSQNNPKYCEVGTTPELVFAPNGDYDNAIQLDRTVDLKDQAGKIYMWSKVKGVGWSASEYSTINYDEEKKALKPGPRSARTAAKGKGKGTAKTGAAPRSRARRTT